MVLPHTTYSSFLLPSDRVALASDSSMRTINCVLFDLGNTLIYEVVDDLHSLDELTLRAMPHAVEALERLSTEYRIGLVTDTESSSERSVRVALRKLGLERFFSAVVTSTDVGVRKPDERIYREALRRVNVNAEEAAMVGNDPLCDIFGARRLGMITILYGSDGRCHQSWRARPDYCVDNLMEIPAILANIQTKSENAIRDGDPTR